MLHFKTRSILQDLDTFFLWVYECVIFCSSDGKDREDPDAWALWRTSEDIISIQGVWQLLSFVYVASWHIIQVMTGDRQILRMPSYYCFPTSFCLISACSAEGRCSGSGNRPTGRGRYRRFMHSTRLCCCQRSDSTGLSLKISQKKFHPSHGKQIICVSAVMESSNIKLVVSGLCPIAAFSFSSEGCYRRIGKCSIMQTNLIAWMCLRQCYTQQGCDWYHQFDWTLTAEVMFLQQIGLCW